jgi:hypothetical protein
MSSITENKTINALSGETIHRDARMILINSFKIEKVTSLDAFKSKMINFHALKPAVLKNGVLTIQSSRLQ